VNPLALEFSESLVHHTWGATAGAGASLDSQHHRSHNLFGRGPRAGCRE
jgi:hypothetical protein